MIYKYGTSGFRYKANILIEISVKIGKYLAYYGSYSNKYIGVIITASHNHHLDNGVKIINSSGELLMDEDEKLCTDFINNKVQLKKGDYNPKILIGNDTRRTGPLIKRLIIQGIQSIFHNVIIEDLDYLSTPQMHYEIVSLNQKIKLLYDQYYFNEKYEDQKIIVDCSNGVGTLVLKDLDYKYLVNTKIDCYDLLNNNCGSDDVVSKNKFPKLYDNTKEENRLYASLDGDADRCVFYYESDYQFYLLNGDHISALYILFLKKYDYVVHYIHTSYTNHGLIELLQSLGVKTITTPTGVKHLQKESHYYNLSVYFESNGHGSIHYSNLDDYHEDVQKLLKMQSLYTGDGVSHIYSVDYILTKLNMSKEEWYNLFQVKPNKLYKVNVKDKNIYKCDSSETRLIEPVEICNKIEELKKEFNSFIFVRPSGTEDCVRVYIEGDYEEIFDKIKSILI